MAGLIYIFLKIKNKNQGLGLSNICKVCSSWGSLGLVSIDYIGEILDWGYIETFYW